MADGERPHIGRSARHASKVMMRTAKLKFDSHLLLQYMTSAGFVYLARVLSDSSNAKVVTENCTEARNSGMKPKPCNIQAINCHDVDTLYATCRLLQQRLLQETKGDRQLTAPRLKLVLQLASSRLHEGHVALYLGCILSSEDAARA